MWTAAGIVGWLSGLGIRPGGLVDVELIDVGGPGAGGIPEMPDRVAIVAPAAGAGLAMEGVLDRPEFDLYVRGPQGDPATADVMAQTADRLITGAQFPAQVDGAWLVSVQRMGGRPAPTDRGVDGDRATYTATYSTEIDDT